MERSSRGFTRFLSPVQDAPLTAAAALAVVISAACSSEPAAAPPRECVPVPDAKATTSCTPLYEPSYANVFSKTLKPSCAKSGVSCHGSPGRQGGVSFDDADVAYAQLIDTTQAVRAGDPACSALVARVVATDGNVRMPPGRSIDPGEQCAIIQWIANGAKR